MKKLLILGMLALGLSVAAPQSHAQVRVRIGTRERLVQPRVGLSVNLGTPEYRYYHRTPDGTVIINRQDRRFRRDRDYQFAPDGTVIINRQEPSFRDRDYRMSSDGSVILDRHDQWRHREWMREHGYARTIPER